MAEKRVHPLLTSAKRSAESYQIRQTASGKFNVWRFKDWTQDQSGWRIIATTFSREDARKEVLERLNLEEPTITITFQPMDPEFTWSWG